MIDNIDLRIVKELQRNGRKSYLDLAKMVGVVEGTIRKRMKRLRDQGIIRVIAAPNLLELGYNLIAIIGFQVKMEDLRKVTDDLAQNKHVCYLCWVTGRYDLMAIIVTRSPKELSYIMEKEISTIPSILRTEIFVSLDVIKGTWGLIDTTQLIDNLDDSSAVIGDHFAR